MYKNPSRNLARPTAKPTGATELDEIEVLVRDIQKAMERKSAAKTLGQVQQSDDDDAGSAAHSIYTSESDGDSASDSDRDGRSPGPTTSPGTAAAATLGRMRQALSGASSDENEDESVEDHGAASGGVASAAPPTSAPRPQAPATLSQPKDAGKRGDASNARGSTGPVAKTRKIAPASQPGAAGTAAAAAPHSADSVDMSLASESAKSRVTSRALLADMTRSLAAAPPDNTMLCVRAFRCMSLCAAVRLSHAVQRHAGESRS
jgi:hypothetical protein